MDIELMNKISSLHGPSGNETKVKKFMKENLKNADEILEDRMGGVFGVYKGTEDGPKIMICAHMDEIGAMVTSITKDGLLKMINIGGINPEVLVSQNVYVETTSGKLIKGVVSSIPPHISKDNKFTVEDLTVDIGAVDCNEVKSYGIEIGSFISPVDCFYVTENGKRVVNKAFDDRMGCAVVLELAKEMGNIKHPNTVILGGTVQEEVGLRGAKVSSAMIEPDLFLTIDVSPMMDYLGKPDEGKLGGGFLVRYYDPGCIMPPRLKKYISSLAEKNNIPYQYFKSKGGTDAGAAQYAGIGTLATTIGLPGRYIHSPATMVDLGDVEAAKAIIIKIIEEFNDETLKDLLD